MSRPCFCRCREIQQLYELIADYDIPIDKQESEEFAALDDTFGQLKLAMEEVESNKDENIKNYSEQLTEEMKQIAKDVKEVRNALQHEMILNEDAEKEKVVTYLSDLKTNVDKLQAQAVQINTFQKLFKINEVRLDDLVETAEEANLKLNLWAGSDEFAALTEKWRTMQFNLLNYPLMEEAMNK